MDPSYLKYRFKKSLLTCYSVVLLPENVMFAFFFVKNVKKCPCVTYIRYIYLYTHAYTLCADLTFYLFVARKPPQAQPPLQPPLRPQNHFKSHTKSPMVSVSKALPHKSLHSYHVFLVTRPTIVFLPVRFSTFHLKIEVIVIHKALFRLIILTIFTHFRKDYCHVLSLGFL